MSALEDLRRKLRFRAAAWVRKRQGADVAPLTVAPRRIYILPTRAGLGFGLLLFFMLLAGLNYANSLALFLTFLLGGVVLVAMHLCHRNLLGIRVTHAEVQPTSAGQAARVALAAENPGSGARIALELAHEPLGRVVVDLAERGGALLALDVPIATRGRLRIDRLKLSTAHPFGLFRAWTWLHLPLETLVYPAARGSREPPGGSGGVAGAARSHGPGEDEWSSLREFRDGDSPRRIAWKAYARGAPLLVKEYESLATGHREFDFDALHGLDVEARLEQLARWIVDADAGGEQYELILAGERFGRATGRAHRERCLGALALFGGAEARLALPSALATARATAR